LELLLVFEIIKLSVGRNPNIMGFLLFATEITGVGPRGSLLQDHPAGFGLEFHMDVPVV
jgi:hypothetical protein